MRLVEKSSYQVRIVIPFCVPMCGREMHAVIDIASGLALTDPKIVQGPASILANEARHDAFFRQHSVSDIPNPAPFDTRISGTYALNLASPFILKRLLHRAMPSQP